MNAIAFDTMASARAHLKDLLDAAHEGRSATVRRDLQRAAVVDADRLRQALALLCPANAQLVPEAEGWSVMLPGLPIAADGDTLETALAETVGALREYAYDWADHLRQAPNHANNWGLVQLIELSGDDELVAWLNGA